MYAEPQETLGIYLLLTRIATFSSIHNPQPQTTRDMAENEDQALDEVIIPKYTCLTSAEDCAASQISPLVLDRQDSGRRDAQAGRQRHTTIYRSLDGDGLGANR